jgi:hypothetical protein
LQLPSISVRSFFGVFMLRYIERKIILYNSHTTSPETSDCYTKLNRRNGRT